MIIDIELQEAGADFLGRLLELIKSFVRLPKACYQVSKVEGFMQEVKEAKSNLLYDFIDAMASIYKDEYIEINDKFLGSLRVYKNEMSRGLSKISLDSKEVKFANVIFDEIEGIMRSIKFKRGVKIRDANKKINTILELYSPVVESYKEVAKKIKVARDINKNFVEELYPILDSESIKALERMLKLIDELKNFDGK